MAVELELARVAKGDRTIIHRCHPALTRDCAVPLNSPSPVRWADDGLQTCPFRVQASGWSEIGTVPVFIVSPA